VVSEIETELILTATNNLDLINMQIVKMVKGKISTSAKQRFLMINLITLSCITYSQINHLIKELDTQASLLHGYLIWIKELFFM